MDPRGRIHTYGGFSRAVYLLDEAHEQDLGLCVGPVVGEVLLGLGADVVVARLQGLQELRQLGVNLR